MLRPGGLLQVSAGLAASMPTLIRTAAMGEQRPYFDSLPLDGMQEEWAVYVSRP